MYPNKVLISLKIKRKRDSKYEIGLILKLKQLNNCGEIQMNTIYSLKNQINFTHFNDWMNKLLS